MDKVERKEMTFNQLYNEVAKLSHALLKIGVQKGDRVAAILPNFCHVFFSFYSLFHFYLFIIFKKL